MVRVDDGIDGSFGDDGSVRVDGSRDGSGRNDDLDDGRRVVVSVDGIETAGEAVGGHAAFPTEEGLCSNEGKEGKKSA